MQPTVLYGRLRKT